MLLDLTRRQLLQAGAGAAALLALNGPAGSAAEATLPRRVLGKTGVSVPILAFGTAPCGERQSLSAAIGLYNEALDSGVNYMDTAPSWTGYGKAQYQLGHVLKQRRKEVFLVTKCYEPRADRALLLLEKSLKELQTDHADLVYAHSIGASRMDLETVLGPHGVLATLEKARHEGLTRFIGISGHCRPSKFLKVLEEHDVDVMMNAVNFVDQHTYGFEQKVWPVAAQKNVGLVAMKIFGGEDGEALSNRLLPHGHIPLALRYALSLPHVSTAVVGMATPAELRHNLKLVTNFTPLTDGERAEASRLGREMAQDWGAHLGAVA